MLSLQKEGCVSRYVSPPPAEIHAWRQLPCYARSVAEYKIQHTKERILLVENIQQKIEKEAYEKKAQAELQEIQSKLILMKAKIDLRTADIQINASQQVEALQKKIQDFQKRFEGAQNASEDARDTFQEGLESALNDLRKATDAAVEQILDQ